ncbi:formylglycine-generating enzyme family protein, partial [Hymenobacter terricola]|uniref:formylglycine-generating enzyme family protein n=1 Tax=Hymenobacter terricola TaxID=2819236 RepID=UPI001CF59CF8
MSRSDWGMPITWKYRPFAGVKENETVIAPPAFNEDWNSWYKGLKAYQTYLRGHLNDTAALYLEMKVVKSQSVRLQFKRVLNDMRLRPGDRIVFNGQAKNDRGNTRFSIKLTYIKIGQQNSHAVVKTTEVDTVRITTAWTSLHREFRLPAFDTLKLMVQPTVLFESRDDAATQIQLRALTFSVPATKRNQAKYDALRASFYPKSPAVDRQLYDRKELQWTKKNYISGYAYLWDQDFWDADKKTFTVQKYCDKMKREFGGFQSVLFWYSYPNIGIDQRNSRDFLEALPGGGIAALKAIVREFHANGVKVYFPYTSWEIDTRRTTTRTDEQELAQLIAETDVDGAFLDVYFDAGEFQQELDKVKRGFSLGTEHHPSLQNIQGYNALTSSYGQTLQPYQNNGVSRVKWLIPEHMQWTINRNARDRQKNMAYSWINGQGLIVWENVFGYMNPWNAQDRRDLRKINAIYQQFSGLYSSDSWQPYLPSGHPKVHVSSWENKDSKIWNIITDSAGAVRTVALPVGDKSLHYYDLWSGQKLAVVNQRIMVPIARFGCVVGLKNQPSAAVAALLRRQQQETATPLPATDPHVAFVSTKSFKAPPAIGPGRGPVPGNLLAVKAGEYNLVTKGVKRESESFPDADGKNNNDYRTEKNSFGKELIVHHTQVAVPAFSIMPRAVTNGEYQAFVKASGYAPADKVNYLRHWQGNTCPDSLKNKPVVYVSLDDARAYAAWAGLRLPTEWEW